MQSFLQFAMAKCNPEQAQGIKSLESIFSSTLAEHFASPTTKAKATTGAGGQVQQQPQQPAATVPPVPPVPSEDVEMETFVVDPIEHQQALARWARTQPTKREGQRQDEYDQLKADWLQQAPMQCQKRPRVKPAEAAPTSASSSAKPGTGTGKGDGKQQG